MKKNIKPLLYFAGVALTLLYLTSSVINSARMVSNFEKNVVGKIFQPEGSSLEVREFDGAAHQGWVIKAKRSTGSSDLNQITAYEVQGLILDGADKQKIKISAPVATLNRETWKTVLKGQALVKMLEANIAMQAEQFVIEKEKPFKAFGQVKMLISEDGKKHIKAEKALINQNLNDMIMYQIHESPIAEGMTVQGGVMNFDFADKRLSRIILTQNVLVRSKGTICTAGQMDVLLDASGKPTIAVFTGAPVAYQNGHRISASRIEYVMSTGAIRAAGNVKTS